LLDVSSTAQALSWDAGRHIDIASIPARASAGGRGQAR
jgi:hypothetical protein